MTIKRIGTRRRGLHAAAIIESLEPRTLFSIALGPTGRTATYTDVDGDLVTVTVSKGVLTSANFQTVPAGVGDQLMGINLSGGGSTAPISPSPSKNHSVAMALPTSVLSIHGGITSVRFLSRVIWR